MTSLTPAETAEKIFAECTSFVYIWFAKMSDRLVFDGVKKQLYCALKLIA